MLFLMTYGRVKTDLNGALYAETGERDVRERKRFFQKTKGYFRDFA